MKKIILAAMLLYCAAITAGCSKKDPGEVNIACFPNITHAQALVLKDRGTLEEKLGDGIKVNWLTFNAGPSEIEALFAGEVDIGYIGPVPAISGYVQADGDLRIIAGASNGGSVLVARGDAGINSATDLAGKTVTVPQFGNTQHLSLLGLLSANGLSPTTSGGNVQVTPSSNADVANLMEQKNIDAAIVPEPWGSILELTKGAKVVLDYDEIDPTGIPSTAVVIVSRDFLEKRRDVVEKFIEAHKEATVFINENPGEAKKIVNSQITEITQIPIEADVLDSAFKRMEITYEIPSESIMDFAGVSANEQFIKKLPDDNIIDGSFLK